MILVAIVLYIIMPDFLAKSKLLVVTSSESDFPTLRARLVFAKLRKAFIEAQISYYLIQNIIFVLKLMH